MTSGPHTATMRLMSFDDYPPGTPLPAFEPPDTSSFNRVERYLFNREWPKIEARQRQRFERLRDAYYARRSGGSATE